MTNISGEPMRIKSFSDVIQRYSIYQNPEVLEKGYVPETLDQVLHREEFIELYILSLQGALKGYIPNNIILKGERGLGKTLITDLVTDNLMDTAQSLGINVHVIKIRCEDVSASANVLREINSKMPRKEGIKLEKKGMSIDNNFLYFCKLYNDYDGILILVLDEINHLAEPDLLNRFARLKENGHTKKNVCVIGITNDVKFYENLSPNTKAAFDKNNIRIPQYKAYQLKDIIKKRVELGLKEGVIEESLIDLTAALAAQEGDARKGIAIIRKAAELVDLSNRNIITEKDIREAELLIQQDEYKEYIMTISVEKKKILYSLATESIEMKSEEVPIGIVYKRYKTVNLTLQAERNLSERRVLDILAELKEDNIISDIKVKAKPIGGGRCSYIRLGKMEACILMKDWLLPILKNLYNKSTISNVLE
jgi:cell division control protein 6